MTDDSAGPEFIFNTLIVEGPREPLHEFLGAASGPGFIDWRPEWYGVYEHIYFNLMRAGMPTVQAADKLAKKFRDIAWWAHERGRVASETRFAPAAVGFERAVSDSEARAAQGIRRGRAGVDVGELGGALADSARDVRDGATARGPDETEAGRGVPLSQRGLVALDRAQANAGAVAGAQLRDEGGVFAGGHMIRAVGRHILVMGVYGRPWRRKSECATLHIDGLFRHECKEIAIKT